MTDRVPDDVVRRLQAEETPPACAPHCHQAALIESLGEWLQRRAETDDERHRQLLAGLSEVRTGLRTLEDQVLRLSLTQAELATAEATQRARAIRVVPESEPPVSAEKRRIPKWVYGVAAGVGTTVGAAVVEYLRSK